MPKTISWLVFLFSLVFIGFSLVKSPHILAVDPVEDLQHQIDELEHLKQLSVNATKPLESELSGLESRINSARNGITAAKNKSIELAADIEDREEELAIQYYILSRRIAEQYKRSRTFSPFMTFLATQNAANFTKDMAYRSSVKAQDNRLIDGISQDIEKLEADRAKLEADQVRLASLEKQLDDQADFFRVEIKGAKDYQNELAGKIATLNARQQEIINARSGTFTASIGDSELADDYNASIKGFRESAPAGSFAVFSFGAFTHRKGMSQYGARGRAQSGQNYQQILKAYYGKESVNKDTGGSIRVSGVGEIDFESKYLYGIAEMPSSWHPEALKAQAVAARTYAYRYKTEGKEICTTEACQVFNNSKSANPPQSWKDAVDQTKGQVLEDVVTYYASTHGGYASPIGWDTTDGSGGSNFLDKSYDKVGGSPWLYKSWYTKGYSPSSDKCGRSSPWLTGEELADIINAARFRDDRVTPVTTSCWGGNPYSYEELRAKSDGPSNVTGVAVSQGNGNTGTITFQTNKGEIKLSGSEFKTAFNLRAPGYLSIPQSSFAFFNIEHK
ncbi:MAG: hypothetical protein HOA24_03570 [Candidatus Pacebacteria bacterium]|jgi:peptidoglycan hydrolase CwlO-like protein|nr:hypothetical protein [Candidatus Paceibacterota bacterium]MBT4005387.1 hypothetical protein [Candidatus Paceibacterota bacterium]MBT4359096.1 hypothetical protein [Candidatus Paceibacterota bacterium]MBT6899048.1 hypothetical protein [Candidatus Paceibacterota bacterium]MBT7183566.1 hypothetical protein [Candidatus Paceibacterota bacterium]